MYFIFPLQTQSQTAIARCAALVFFFLFSPPTHFGSPPKSDKNILTRRDLHQDTHVQSNEMSF